MISTFASGMLVIGAMLAPVVPGFALATRRRLQGKEMAAPLVTIGPATTEDVAALEALPIPSVTWNALLVNPSGAVVFLRAGEQFAGVAAGRVDEDGVGHVLTLFVAPGTATALARVKAWDELQAVKNEMREVDHRLDAITGHLARALLAATNGFDPIGDTVHSVREKIALCPLTIPPFADSMIRKVLAHPHRGHSLESPETPGLF